MLTYAKEIAECPDVSAENASFPGVHGWSATEFRERFSRLLMNHAQFTDSVLLTNRAYVVRTARDFSDISAALKIRASVYGAMGYIRPFNPNAALDSYNGFEVPDEYDCTSTFILLERRGVTIGTARIIPDNSEVGLPAARIYGASTLESLLPAARYSRAELSRLCILEEFRNTFAMFNMVGGMYAFGVGSAEGKGTTCAFLFESIPGRMVELYSKVGAKATGMVQPHAVGSSAELMVWPLDRAVTHYVEKWGELTRSQNISQRESPLALR